MGSSLVFVELDDNGKLVINEDTMKKIKSISEEIAVVGVMGMAEVGKSFTLNELMKHDGFTFGDGGNRCSTNIFLWSDPLPQAGGHQILLFDSQGTSPYINDNLTFLLLLLCSSIINIQLVDKLYDHQIRELKFMRRVGSKLKVTEEPEPSSHAPNLHIREVLPKLMWLIRDCVSVFLNGTPDEHLSRALEEKPGYRLNDVRELIKEHFLARHCHALPRPSAVDAELKGLHVNDENLRGEYVKARDDFVNFVLRETKAKKVNDVPLTGPMLVEVTRLAVAAFNQDKPLVIQTIWRSARAILDTQGNAYKGGTSAMYKRGRPNPVRGNKHGHKRSKGHNLDDCQSQSSFRPRNSDDENSQSPPRRGKTDAEPSGYRSNKEIGDSNDLNNTTIIRNSEGTDDLNNSISRSSEGTVDLNNNNTSIRDALAQKVLLDALESYDTSFNRKKMVVADRCKTAWEKFLAVSPLDIQDTAAAKNFKEGLEVLYTTAHTEASQDALKFVRLAELGILEPEAERLLKLSMDSNFKIFLKLRGHKAFQTVLESAQIPGPL